MIILAHNQELEQESNKNFEKAHKSANFYGIKNFEKKYWRRFQSASRNDARSKSVAFVKKQKQADEEVVRLLRSHVQGVSR